MSITDKNKPTIERLKDLQQLYEAGILNKEEMEAEKAEILGKNKPNETPATPPQPPTAPPVPPTPATNAAAESEQDVDYNAYINEKEPFWSSTKGIVTIVAIAVVAVAAVIFGVRQCGSSGASGAYGADSLGTDTSYIDTTGYAFDDEPANDFKHIKEVRGRLDVDIQWPLALEGVDDIEQLQRCIISRVFTYKTNDINTYIERISKELKDKDATGGKFRVEYKGKMGDWHVFGIYYFVDWNKREAAGQETYLMSEIMGDMYYDNELGRSLTFADIATSEKAMYNFFEDYNTGIPPSSDWFEISPNGIIFYCIAANHWAYDVFLDYYEMDDVLSETFKRKVYKIMPEDKWVNVKFTGTMSDPDVEDSWPIEISFQRKGQQIRNCVYKNVRIGGKIRMKGEIAGDYFILKGKDGVNDFQIMLNKKTDEESTAIDGDNELTISSGLS